MTEFKSQICTTVEQSKRLLSLGLRKETADMTHHYLNSIDSYELKDIEFSRVMHLKELANKKPVFGISGDDLYAKDIPAWGLHRLIEILDTNPFVFYLNAVMIMSLIMWRNTSNPGLLIQGIWRSGV